MTVDHPAQRMFETVTPMEVLSGSPIFAALPADARQELAAHLVRVEVPAGEVVVREGEEGELYYLISEGEAEVWAAKGQSSIALNSDDGGGAPTPQRHALVARRGPGDGFGEIALLLGGPRRATVRAATDLVLYTLDGKTFTRIVNQHRGLAVGLEEEMMLRGVETFLGRGSPFATLPLDALRWLAVRLQPLSFRGGEEIVREGDVGDAFYVLRTGRAEAVVERPDGTQHRINTLNPGEPFGEQALVTGEPRAATVRALEPVEVLRLSREDFETVLREHRERGQYFLQLTLQRQRPERIEHWIMEERTGRDNEVVYILKDTRNNRYVKLAEQSMFLWNLMDGQNTVRDLTLAYFSRYHVFGLDAVMRCMMQLQAAGFVRIQRIDVQRMGEVANLTLVQRIGLKLMPWIIHYVSLPDLDGLVTVLYRFLLRPLYYRPSQVLLLFVALCGAAFFIRYLTLGGIHESGNSAGAVLVLATIVGFALQGFLHEAGHAATCKHFGREVHRAGVGWYLFMPVAFVDTSDMWLAGKWARAAVAFAGPYTNFVLSGVASLVIPLTSNAAAQAILFQFALTGYAIGLLNLNPLLEFDGYYVLMDALDIPNLRTKALGFVGTALWRVEQTVRAPRLQRIFTTYGVLALLYTLFVAASILSGYHRYFEGAFNHVLPPLVSALLGWCVAGMMTWLILLRAWRDVRKGARRAWRGGAQESIP